MTYTMEQCDALVKATYGKGITPNPLALECVEWQRQQRHRDTIQLIDDKIISLFEPRFITPPETSGFIGALVTMTDAKQILELGTCTGFTSLHILKAIIGKLGAHLVSIDARPAHDPDFFASPWIAPYWRHIVDWTPKCLKALAGQDFDMVFVDTDHSFEHTRAEVNELLNITHPGSLFLFHDLPQWQGPDNRNPSAVRTYIESLVGSGLFKGLVLPTGRQLDCARTWGEDYPPQCSPHLGVFIRQ